MDASSLAAPRYAVIRACYNMARYHCMGIWPLHGDLGRIADALAFADDTGREAARAAVRARAITLFEALGGKVVEWAAAAAAMQQGFSNLFDVELVPGGLTDSEQSRANELYGSRYANPEWITRR